MKKMFSLFITTILIVSSLLPFSAMAYNEQEILPEWYDVALSKNEFEEIISNGNSYISDNERASNLISTYAIGISNVGNTLYIAGETIGSTEVVKSGFKEVVIQRRTSSNASWSDYITYEDLYIDQFGYELTKAVTVPSGYQYRVTCIHYAKKNIFSTQKIDNVSNTVTI